MRQSRIPVLHCVRLPTYESSGEDNTLLVLEHLCLLYPTVKAHTRAKMSNDSLGVLEPLTFFAFEYLKVEALHCIIVQRYC